MRAVCLHGETDPETRDVHVMHAEVTVATDSGMQIYAQAHDNGISRYYVLSRVSYFGELEEEDEDILEEYYSRDQSELQEGMDFIGFLDDWKGRTEGMNDCPYESSRYAVFFDIAERMLDGMSEEGDDETQV